MLIRAALTDITVNAYLPPAAGATTEEPIIRGGTGSLTTVVELPVGLGVPSVQYILEVDTGTRVNAPRIGEVVAASGDGNDERRVVLPGPLETVSAGSPAIFRGPYK
jgi:hypothetical protein